MDIQELHYFLATYDCKSYAGAAKRLFVSRQALRQKLHHLEEEIGAPLFMADGKTLRATRTGEVLNLECRPIVHQFDAMERKMQNYAQNISGELKLTLGFAALTFLNPDIMLAFQQRYPQLQLQMTENSDTIVMADVISGRAVLGIVGASSYLLGEVDAVQLQKSGLYLRVHKDHPLSGRSEIYPKDLDQQEFISFGEQNHSHWLLYRECMMHGCMPRFTFCTQDTNAAMKIAAKYKAITWSAPPERITYPAPDFRVIPLKFSDPSWGTYAITKRGSTVPAAVQLLIEYLCQEARNV